MKEEVALITGFIAMALHFVVNDFGLRDRDRKTYDPIGRWVLAAAAVVGWGSGTIFEV